MLASLLIFFKRIWGEFNECGAKYATNFKWKEMRVDCFRIMIQASAEQYNDAANEIYD